MKINKYLPIVLFVVLLDFQAIFNSNWDNVSERQIIFNKLDKLYHQQNFYAYYDSLQNFLLKVNPRISDGTKFKFAFAAYQNKDFKKAARLFSELKESGFLPSYSAYFEIRSIWGMDTSRALPLARDYLKQYRNSPLADSLLIPLAETCYRQKKFLEARKYFQLAIERKIRKTQRVEFKKKAADCLWLSGRKDAALKEYYQIIKKHPSHQVCEQLVDELEQKAPEWYRKKFLKIYPVLSKHRRYDEARVKLEKFIRETSDVKLQEEARYLLVRNYYAQGRYSTALIGFKNLLANLKNKALEPKIRLYLARAYLAVGNVQKSIDLYKEYADRYPRRRMAAEVIWKVALLEERMGRLQDALSFYQKLYRRWPHSSFGSEARFRYGYTLFRLGKIEQAERVFNKIRFSRTKDFFKNRAAYWVSICREMKSDTLTASRIRRDLARNMWDDYYTLKSYLLEKEYMDSTNALIKAFKRIRNPLNYYGKGFQKHIDHFERVFLIDDLLGRSYAVAELSTLKIDRREIQEWIALAETYKRLKEYGRAYRLYDQINQRFYSKLAYGEKLFILRERFPYYYDQIVDKFCRRYGLEKELVLGLIKQESAFDHRAKSFANAYGLMQLIPTTARDMAFLAGKRLKNIDLLFDPEFNIHLGTLYLKQLHRQFKGDKAKILAAYNAGPHRVKRWLKLNYSNHTDGFIENIEFKETRNYVKRVMKNYWAYKLLYNDFQVDRRTLLSMEDDLENWSLAFGF
ncbi:Lytic transglycosylase catalytic [Caldithrix abyssi DSM 13497]|uniref:Lytic transglycosylase catalytic n=1 Tax=Caldithrix abyssi DSM 13497 TaxID=880073 RepID=H1XR20_CALAY|nr:transglycosylase SLT domain-containing protein [Caldithrix abyssi]APF20035.1 Tetratricopeptide repeat-containing protein [Caldithrix abyssi DSM 13497]EHO40114.1 Lytic transglycosylase catalytic [Caldithrix abyssi DSM 13497]